VGADNPAFESLPFDKTIGGVPRSLHEIFIAGMFPLRRVVSLAPVPISFHGPFDFHFHFTSTTSAS
jgi:hypothetical protein